MEALKDQWLPGIKGQAGMNRWNTEDLQGTETTLCDSRYVSLDICSNPKNVQDQE